MEQCVSFILLDGANYLLEKRRANKSSDAGKLAVPGGRMEAGETQMTTLQREMLEELALTPTVSRYLCSLQHFSEKTFLIHYYLVSEWTGTAQALEAESIHWACLDNLPKGAGLQPQLAADLVALGEYQRLKGVLK